LRTALVLNRRTFGIAAACVVSVVIVRALPLLSPIRADSLVQDHQAVEFTDRNGLALGTLLSRDQEHTAAVPLAAVSPLFLKAIIASEDNRFYAHGAVDYRAMLRATLQTAEHRRIVSGASTLTMQLARMVRPLPDGMWGKLLQIWTAWRLEAGMTKGQILEAYVNRVPMGGNVYGVEAAARVYFGLPAARVDLAQASLLAAIPNDPGGLLPYGHWSALRGRQAYVLSRMLASGYIDEARRRRALEEQILLRPRDEGIVAAPHLLFWLASGLSRGRSHVTTTIDRPLQEFVETQVRQVIAGLATHNVHHAAVVVVDNHTGQVLAYVGSPDYFADTQSGSNDGVQALRQPGSALKPFLYELALENRTIHPNTILADVSTHYSIPGGMLYSPSDYSNTFQGPVRVRIALADSLNVPAVHVLADVGVPAFLERLHALGFAHLTHRADYYGLGLTLGGGEVSLWELTGAYVTLARQGLPVALSVYGKPGSSNNALGGQNLDYPNPRAAWSLVTDILSDPHARAKAFGVDSVLDMPFAAAVKTGTSSDYRDTWTVGFTRDYTVGVWVGNFDGEPMRQVSGVTGAAPLWNRVITHLHEKNEPDAFSAPPGLVMEPICPTTGLRPGPSCSAVYEYLYPQDLATYRAAQPRSDSARAYDPRLAAQPKPVQRGEPATSAVFRILFPRDGDVFARYPSTGEFAAGEQGLQFQTTAAKSRVRWFINGRRVAAAWHDAVFWTLQAGTWQLRAVSGSGTDQITFRVIAAHQHVLRRGFSLAHSN